MQTAANVRSDALRVAVGQSDLALRAPWWQVVVDALPLTLVALLISWATLWSAQRPDGLQPLSVSSVEELEAALTAAGYTWPPYGGVPRLALQRMPDGLESLPAAQRKRLFFSALAPLVLAENDRLRAKRERIGRLLAQPRRAPAVERELSALAKRYGVAGDLSNPAVQRRLLRRIDEIPLGLALAQAAKESGWGTSRFAREGNNLFGVWTWDVAHGLVPQGRAAGSRHLVRIFPDLQASVRNYAFTLNTGAAYRELRELREQMRAQGSPLDALALASTLTRYSERGSSYVRELRWLILSNGLHELGEVAWLP